MKKIILFIIMFILTGCYDYVEINNLIFVSGIAIDYQNDEYILTFEMLEEDKPITISEKGYTLASAFDNITLKISKIPFYHHLKVVIISEDVAQYHLKEISDYITRSPEIRNEFYLTVSPYSNAKDILNSHNGNDKPISDIISTLIKTNNYNFDISYNKTFEDMYEKLLNDKVDALANDIKTDGINIILTGLSSFRGYNLTHHFDKDKSYIINLLNNEKETFTLNDNNISIKVYESNVSYSFDNNINISIKAYADISYIDNINLHDENVYKSINNSFSNILKNNILSFINESKVNDVDVIALRERKWINKKIDDHHIYDNQINIDVNLIINRKGLSFGDFNE